MTTVTDRFGGSIQTITGVLFYPADPRPDEIFIEDIAHALSHLCRFVGHVNSYYSVAEHSVRVSLVCNFQDALWGLLHDASEAYLTDIPRPLKHMPFMDEYRRLEKQLMAAVCERFDLPVKQPDSVTFADNVLLATEKRDLRANLYACTENLPDPLPQRIVPLSPQRAKQWFIYRFDELMGNL